MKPTISINRKHTLYKNVVTPDSLDKNENENENV
jgi:hypothetical protein